jgi:TnpA family transposase
MAARSGLSSSAIGRSVTRNASVPCSVGHCSPAYREGQEDQLGALGLIVNTIVVYNRVLLPAPLHDRGAYRVLNTPQDAAAA